MGSKINNNFQDIDIKLCTFCGTCVGVCPKNALKIENGHIILCNECISCGLCYNICPGIEVNFHRLNNQLFKEPNPDKNFGYYNHICVAHAINDDIRLNASSGGVVTSLLCFLLDNGYIDGAIVIGNNTEKPWEYEIKLARTREEICEARQSKYIQIPLNIILKEVECFEGNLAYVGIPCHIHGIRKLQEIRLKSACKIKFCIGLFCGFNMENQVTDDLIKKIGIDKNDIISLKYRGGGHPGGFTVETKNIIRKLDKSLYNIYNLIYVPRRCLLCIDLTNELADISVGDIWMEKYRNGWSSVIIRSKEGLEIFNKATERKYLYHEEISSQTLFTSHSHLLKHKKENAPVRIYLSQVKPNYGLNLLKPTSLKKIHGIVLLVTLNVFHSKIVKMIVGILPLHSIEFVSMIINRSIRKGSI